MANERTRKLVTLAALAAIALVVTLVGRISIAPAAPFLKYDPKDVIILIAGFLYGPLPAIAVSVVVSLIEMVTVSDSGIIGMVMNVLASCSFVCPAVLLYRRKNTVKSAFTGLAMGVLAMTAVMLLWNYFLTPIYMGTPREVVAAMLVPVFLPFNLIKGTLNAGFAMLLYKPLFNALYRSNRLPKEALPVTGATVVGAKQQSAVLVIVSFAVVLCGISGVFLWQVMA